MARKSLTNEQVSGMSLARKQILTAANQQRRTWRKYHAKNINEAVAVVRHYGSVSDEVLLAAGFRAKKGQS